MSEGKLLWSPSEKIVQESELERYRHYVNSKYAVSANDYKELWQWSIDNKEIFWNDLIDWFGLVYEGDRNSVLVGKKMPNYNWFPNVNLNFAENLTRYAEDSKIAIISVEESGLKKSYTWKELLTLAANIQLQFDDWGLQPGDRVCGVLPNAYETSAAFLAAAASGLIWSCCSPDFGIESIIDRFEQISPKVYLYVDSYNYGGKVFDLHDKNQQLIAKLKSVSNALNLSSGIPKNNDLGICIEQLNSSNTGLTYKRVNFSSPLWVLYSSGTTGAPKAITHSHGGVLLELNKYHAFHNDVKKDELFFWYTTTGWMMWNFLHGAWLRGAAILIYDGSPAYPEVDFLWKLAAETKVNHFGTSAPYILANKKADIDPKANYDLSNLRSIGSTGSPLPPEGFDYVYEKIKDDIWLTSMSGGTDVCTAFVGGCIVRPVYEGEIQCRALGCALYCLDEDGNKLENEEGEMVITEPMPCMPIYFWNDEEKVRYNESYFEMYDGLWRHGDWIRITQDDGVVIYGRSDATLNKQGIRIGTSEIYRSLDHIQEIVDSLIVNIEKKDGDHFMPLFVMLKEGIILDDILKKRIKSQLRSDYSPRHVPDEIIQVADIPYTLSGKKMETPIKKILMGRPVEKCVNADTMRNPTSINYFVEFAKEIN
ncbi:MAG: acetoacetate--CoA ligase [Saprospiraceae bacterium]|jgi:acetoacetyl-CoA synthetase|uniref:acetoacetate--CoA ligase n=1 Tax=Candidatus Brachybacter algidus TaxID=2982024 RepID=UPI001B596D84|nr:acetoacetate--CoA ligase [Candidatus Brachybacter algidus]MBP7538926.1 acetoacetate--CoA ligase [Saprospiraceae bacterium]MBK7602892.1 acetoacetate--CoA ligase [Candidatus Brachybacter algidus]MBK9552120.1 acetoacetate--CoA ligase [Candidatus Brachybacter algidus]MBP8891119.1 acetoacetate--CoA ligase [Saprospiraceae bacterium]MBP9124243.1 acetoacetate--CoA ligase [Saprospiraceae bacterium]